jgi:regulator of RNase E activity RraA
VQIAAVGEPVGVAGCLVRPGDLVVGDSDGVVVVPAEAEDEILGYARLIHAAEQRIRAALARGVPLRQARAESGYHQLQRRQ